MIHLVSWPVLLACMAAKCSCYSSVTCLCDSQLWTALLCCCLISGIFIAPLLKQGMITLGLILPGALLVEQ